MKLEMIVDSLDGVDAALQPFYTKKGDKYELAVNGAKSEGDVVRVQEALNKERGTTKELKAKLSAWRDLDPEEVLPKLDKLPELEAAASDGRGKYTEADLEKRVEARLAGIKAPLERELQDLRSAHEEASSRVTQYETAEKRRTIHDAVRQMAVDSGAEKTAYASEHSGLMLLSESLFEVNEEGKVAVRDGAPGGLTPGLGVADIVRDLQKQHPYFWPPSSGGGARPGKGGASSDPFRSNDFPGRIKMLRESPEQARQMMEAAGLENPGQTYKEPDSK